MGLPVFFRLKKIVRVCLFFVFFFGSSNPVWSDHQHEITNRATGLNPMSDEEVNHMMTSWNQIIGIKPNKLGEARINCYANKQGMPQINIPLATSYEDEFITLKCGELHTKILEVPKYSLPATVDNSLLPCFPPIGDQGHEGSCVGFAATYYQGSHEIGLANGLNNKNSNEGILSPRWTYNMINYGKDQGSVAPDAFNLMSQNGAVNINKLPYQPGNYLPWDLNTQDWIDALSNRTSRANYISNLDVPNTSAISLIKQALNNGHVVTFATYFYSWVLTRVKDDPKSSSDNTFVGELACSWMNGYSGGHYVTIVGYNDNIWIDINNNGQVDPGEKGAFLVANSWGSAWGNKGFIWISYDAFYSVSQVPNGPTVGRVPAARALNNLAVSITAKRPNYKPSIYAEFTLDQTKRNEISILGGLSYTNQTMPALTFQSGAIVNQGGSLRFDGSSIPIPMMGTFVLDMSDLLQSPIVDHQRFWLCVQDNAPDAPTTITSYSLTDTVHGTSISNTTSVPTSIDNSVAQFYIDYTFGPSPVPDTTGPLVSFTYPYDGSIISGQILLTINATDDIGVELVEIYIDGYRNASEAFPPYGLYIDTKELTNGPHTFKAIAYDRSNNKTEESITVTVMN